MTATTPSPASSSTSDRSRAGSGGRSGWWWTLPPIGRRRSPVVAPAPRCWVAIEIVEGLFDVAFDGLAVLDEHGRYLSVNPVGCEILGGSPRGTAGPGVLPPGRRPRGGRPRGPRRRRGEHRPHDPRSTRRLGRPRRRVPVPAPLVDGPGPSCAGVPRHHRVPPARAPTGRLRTCGGERRLRRLPEEHARHDLRRDRLEHRAGRRADPAHRRDRPASPGPRRRAGGRLPARLRDPARRGPAARGGTEVPGHPADQAARRRPAPQGGDAGEPPLGAAARALQPVRVGLVRLGTAVVARTSHRGAQRLLPARTRPHARRCRVRPLDGGSGRGRRAERPPHRRLDGQGRPRRAQPPGPRPARLRLPGALLPHARTTGRDQGAGSWPARRRGEPAPQAGEPRTPRLLGARRHARTRVRTAPDAAAPRASPQHCGGRRTRSRRERACSSG